MCLLLLVLMRRVHVDVIAVAGFDVDAGIDGGDDVGGCYCRC